MLWTVAVQQGEKRSGVHTKSKQQCRGDYHELYFPQLCKWPSFSSVKCSVSAAEWEDEEKGGEDSVSCQLLLWQPCQLAHTSCLPPTTVQAFDNQTNIYQRGDVFYTGELSLVKRNKICKPQNLQQHIFFQNFLHNLSNSFYIL